MNPIDSTPEEQLSALADGELAGAQREQALAALLQSSEAQKDWHLYHLAGDVMRSADLSPASTDLDFLNRFQARMALEQVPLYAESVKVQPTAPSANEGQYRLGRVMKGAALGFVAVLGVLLWNGMTGQDAALVTAQQAAPANAVAAQDAGEPQTMIRDPELDALLSAHHEMGGNSALQLPSGFLRNATFERSNR